MIVYSLQRSDDNLFKLSMASAYSSLILLCGTLVLGPWTLLKNRPYPVSTDLRRDIGIWAGMLGLFHTAVGLQVHMKGNFWLYFVFPANQGRAMPIRYDLFGLTNYAGLAATILLLTLLALSNDFSLRQLGARRWKGIQRWNYLLFFLVAAHGAAYQLIEKRKPFFVVIFIFLLFAAAAFQFSGYRKKKTVEFAKLKSQGEVPLDPTGKRAT